VGGRDCEVWVFGLCVVLTPVFSDFGEGPRCTTATTVSLKPRSSSPRDSIPPCKTWWFLVPPIPSSGPFRPLVRGLSPILCFRLQFGESRGLGEERDLVDLSAAAFPQLSSPFLQESRPKVLDVFLNGSSLLLAPLVSWRTGFPLGGPVQWGCGKREVF